MPENQYIRNTMIKGAVIAFGVVFGGLTGPIWLHGSTPLSAATGAAIGGTAALIFISALLKHKEFQSDTALENRANSALREGGLEETVRLYARDRRLFLEGEVDDESKIEQAERMLQRLPGVEGVKNHLTVVRPAGPVDPEEIRLSLLESLRRHSEVNAHGIQVAVDRSRVILEGKVHSWRELSVAEKVAWDTPGIKGVENRLEVLV